MKLKAMPDPHTRNRLARFQMDRFYKNRIAAAAITLNLAAGDTSGENGGVLHIVVYSPDNASNPTDIATCIIGEKVDAAELNYYAAEKIRRLRQRRHAERLDETASSASADNGLGRYAGCIVAFCATGCEYYFSFSGLKEQADEALVYALAKELGLLVDERYKNELNALAEETMANTVTP